MAEKSRFNYEKGAIMLLSLSIRNVVLIDKLDIDFERGLSVFTGETGAGKSILLDSLALVLGGRADTKLIRHGADSLSVSACFMLPLSHPAYLMLSEQGLPPDEEIILRRTLNKDGKSKAFVNDQPISVSFLKALGETLVEIHGQFASHHLLNPAVHLDVLDSYGNLDGEMTNCRRAFIQWKYKQTERDKMEQNLISAKEEEAFIRASVKELQELAPKVGEEEELTAQRTRLMNAEKIIEQTQGAYLSLSEERTGVLHQLNLVYRQLEKANQLAQNQFQDILSQIDGAQNALTDALSALESQMQECESPDALGALDDRLFALKDVARKHQVCIDELPDLLKSFEKNLTDLDTGDQAVIALRREEEEARLDYIKCAQKLSKQRHKVAKTLDRAVNGELPALKLGKARFISEVTDLPESEWGVSGMDKVIFMAATNAGIPPAPIQKIASGGELSRFMLALKVILARAEAIPTIVFDEVDTGIGGATADAVGDRLSILAQMHQVLVVTHSPQVASYGVHHWTVVKKETAKGVTTSVNALDYDGRLSEIARMLSGAKVTESGRKMAKELLEKTCQKKSMH